MDKNSHFEIVKINTHLDKKDKLKNSCSYHYTPVISQFTNLRSLITLKNKVIHEFTNPTRELTYIKYLNQVFTSRICEILILLM